MFKLTALVLLFRMAALATTYLHSQCMRLD